MEGETIKKKYTSILDMLKKERLTFSNQLEALESTIKKQDDEIERLKNTQKAISHNKTKLTNRMRFYRRLCRPEMLLERVNRNRKCHFSVKERIGTRNSVKTGEKPTFF